MNNPLDPHSQQPVFGLTRTRVMPRHALITSDGFVPSTWPGSTGFDGIFHISPAMGAGFNMASCTTKSGGRLPLPARPGLQRVLYILQGSLRMGGCLEQAAEAGDFVYLAAGDAAELIAEGSATVIIFEKSYESLAGSSAPESFIGTSADIAATAFLGNPKALLQVLLPDTLAFDLAVNLFTYQPGAFLPFVETHIMEHGLFMLSGHGIYRLEDAWYPVRAGDVIWMAPYCPQWFVAMGEEPASYLYYKNIHRLPTLI